MDFYFDKQGTHTYLVYTVGEDDAIDSMSLGMLTNNRIQGLAQTLFTQMDATRYIKYDVSSKISVKQFFAGQVNRKRLIGVFNGIVDAMLSAEDYMIDENSILLDLNYIFADVSTCETVLICLPIVSDDLGGKDLGAFFKNVMFTTQFDQTENCDHVAMIINYLNSTPVFSLTEFKNLLENIGGTSAQTRSQQPAVQKQQVQQAQVQQTQVQQTRVQQTQVQQAQVQRTQVQQTQVQQQKTVVQTSANQTNAVNSQVQQENPGKTITMMGLLMHYSKENAEIYKKQKAAKKSGQASSANAPASQRKKSASQPGFAIPGQNAPANQGFAIPGQQTSVQQTSVQQASVQQASVQKSVQQSVQQTAVNQQSAYTSAEMPQGYAASFGETTVLGGGGGIGETTVLGASPAAQVKPHLIRAKNNEKIDLNKPVFRIGKEKSYVDYFIGDNSAISRSHANIISREGEYFIVDTNSMNHTYVNGQMIQSNVETKLAHGTRIRLANEDFEFRLY